MSFFENDAAVSEVLGFVIITGIITAAVTMVLMIGYPMYQDSVTDAHMTNMKEGFDLLSANGNKVAMSDSPVQSSELKLYGGTLGMKDDGDLIITGYSGGNQVVYLHEKPMALEYMLGDKDVSYTMGGVFERDGTAVATLKKPLAYISNASTPPTLVLPVVIFQNNAQAFAGKGISRVTLSSTYYSKSLMVISYPSAQRANVDTVVITLNSKYNAALLDYYQKVSPAFQETSATGTTITLTGHFPAGITLYVIPYYLDASVQ